MASSSELLSKTLECPVCLETLEKPIKQCMKGHSFCNKCLDPNHVKVCPVCRGSVLETRNYTLEQLLETMVLPCENKGQGCQYLLEKELLKLHMEECLHRKRKCPGQAFCKWKCDWVGYGVLDHFKAKHPGHATMEYTTVVSIPYNNKNNFTDMQVIPAHYHLFYYKHKIDVNQQRAYWCIQYVGPKKQASYYYYEFEIFIQNDAVRKYKITEYCQSDAVDANEIFASEKCVAVPLKTLNTYVEANSEFSFRFRIMKQKKEEAEAKVVPKVPQRKTTAPRSKSATRQRHLPYSENIAWLPHPYNQRRF